jgi:hypothetical protein
MDKGKRRDEDIVKQQLKIINSCSTRKFLLYKLLILTYSPFFSNQYQCVFLYHKVQEIYLNDGNIKMSEVSF